MDDPMDGESDGACGCWNRPWGGGLRAHGGNPPSRRSIQTGSLRRTSPGTPATDHGTHRAGTGLPRGAQDHLGPVENRVFRGAARGRMPKNRLHAAGPQRCCAEKRVLDLRGVFKAAERNAESLSPTAEFRRLLAVERQQPGVRMRRSATCLAPLLAACVSVPALAAGLSYNGDIRPILVENCFSCHGADSAARKADLRLDRRDDGHRGRGDRAGRSGFERRSSTGSCPTIPRR